jgi:proline iminopeptidase
MNVDQYTHMWGPSEFTATGSLKTFDCSDRLEEIRIPVLLTCGEFDEAAPASVTHFGGLFANARVKVFAGASHEHHIEKQSEYLSTVGAFLREAAQDRNR